MGGGGGSKEITWQLWRLKFNRNLFLFPDSRFLIQLVAATMVFLYPVPRRLMVEQKAQVVLLQRFSAILALLLYIHTVIKSPRPFSLVQLILLLLFFPVLLYVSGGKSGLSIDV